MGNRSGYRLIAPAVVLSIVSAVFFASIATGQDVEWLVSVYPQTVYVEQPVVVKAYSYSPSAQRIYNVTCNMTLRNATDIVAFWQASGSPVVFTFTVPRPGDYFLELYCTSSVGQYRQVVPLRVLFPVPQVELDARWGRPLRVSIVTPYPYNGIILTVSYQGRLYRASLVNGSARLVLPPLYAPATLVLTLFGESFNYTIVPKTPSLRIDVTPPVFVQHSRVKVLLVDNEGPLPGGLPVNISTSGPCYVARDFYMTGRAYTLVSVNKHPLRRAVCNITASAVLWPGRVVSATRTVIIAPVNITGARIFYTNTTPWDYTFTATVRLSDPVTGNLTLYVDGVPVASVLKHTALFATSYSVTLLPGKHVVEAVFSTGEDKVTLEPVKLVVPRHPYILGNINTSIHAGDKYSAPAYWYAFWANKTRLVLFSVYPGDDYYRPASKPYRLHILYPSIRVDGDRLTVEGAAPGAVIQVYCINASDVRLVLEAKLEPGRNEYTVPATCGTLKTVYRHGAYSLIHYNVSLQQAPVPVYCTAGTPCTLLQPDPRIQMAVIDGREYEPGRPLLLEPGYYTLEVFMKTGQKVVVPVIVEQVQVTVTVYKERGLWRVEIASPHDVTVKLVLANGRLLSLKPGTYMLGTEPVNAYWDYGGVLFVKTVRLGE